MVSFLQLYDEESNALHVYVQQDNVCVRKSVERLMEPYRILSRKAFLESNNLNSDGQEWDEKEAEYIRKVTKQTSPREDDKQKENKEQEQEEGQEEGDGAVEKPSSSQQSEEEDGEVEKQIGLEGVKYMGAKTLGQEKNFAVEKGDDNNEVVEIGSGEGSGHVEDGEDQDRRSSPPP